MTVTVRYITNYLQNMVVKKINHENTIGVITNKIKPCSARHSTAAKEQNKYARENIQVD